MTRVLVAGLDSVPPELFFDRPDFDMPFVRQLMRRGSWGEMESCHPPITVPAWAVMATGRPPSELGLYGFRHRGADLYRGISLPTSGSISAKAIWDYVGDSGGRVAVLGVPPGHPPRAVNGNWLSCFLTPHQTAYASPRDFADKIESWLGGPPLFDAEFRKEDRDRTLEQIYEVTRHKFEIARRCLQGNDWQMAMFVDIAPDRLHHAFWKYFDPNHSGYQKGHRYADVIPRYYQYMDSCLKDLFEGLPPDTVTLIVSDHGSKGMAGCFCVNEWLYREGFLKLKEYPTTVRPIEKCDVDWSKTVAWGWGGYYARIFINRRGREPQGVVSASDYESVRQSLREKLRDVCGPHGEKWDNNVVLSEPSWRGDPPDLMVYFDNLCQRSAGTLGHKTLYLAENDTGPDDAVHAQNGIFLLNGPGVTPSGRTQINILDVAPTVLKTLGLPVPSGLAGKSVYK